MNKIITLLLICTYTFARFDAYPSQECEAFNDMKHKKNSHNIHLDTNIKYTVMRHHKGQNLILVKGEQPAQRWVDDECFSKKSIKESTAIKPKGNALNINDELRLAENNMAQSKHTKKYEGKTSAKQNLLALSWHNAFCETHRYKKECKRSLLSRSKTKKSEQSFVLHGLWPQPRSNSYCNVSSASKHLDKGRQWRDLPSLSLEPKTEEALAVVMPGYASSLHKHEWIKHGTCYGTEANKYYSDAISLINQVNNSALGEFFTKNIGNKITLTQVQTVANKEFGRGAGNRVELRCKNGLVTELWLHLGSGSDDIATLLQKGKQTRSRCKQGRIDKAGFGR
jgi:ribonuclease T2